MEDEIRRSSRTNKGKHSGRTDQDVYYEVSGESEGPVLKKARKSEHIEDATGISKPTENSGNTESEGQVRCDGCNTTDENYDEETDEGGMMIECEECKTWQHAKCMGYPTKKSIPKLDSCNRCVEPAAAAADDKNDELWEIPQETPVSVEPPTLKAKQSETSGKSDTPKLPAVTGVKPPIVSAKVAQVAKTRGNVAKALVNVIVRANTASAEAEQWGPKLEDALYSWAGATDKKYIEKSRSVMALVKKPAVLARLISHELSPADFTLLPVEDIDPDLKDYAEKVRQESIRRSVLTVNDEQSQRIRRTHKGEEIVETKNNENNDDLGVGLVARNVDHRKFEVEKDVTPIAHNANHSNIIHNNTVASTSLYQLGHDDDDDYSHESTKITEHEHEHEHHEHEVNVSDGVSDDELDFILKAKTPKEADKQPVAEKSETKKLPVARTLPPTMPTEFWAGEIVFPDVATFGVSAEFVSCTHYQKPKDNTTASFHNKAMRVCKELMEKRKYQVEGRLDRARADPYLEQIVKSRDLYLVKLRKEDPSYSKVYEYLSTRSKVGVLSNRAPMVKDAYLFALNHNAPSYMKFAPTLGEGLYVLFSVKKDYTPAAKSILKKTPQSSVKPAPTTSAASLDNILSKLESTATPGLSPAHLPQRPQQYASSAPIQGMQTTQLSQDQMSYLSSIVQQNPHVQSDPQALLNLLQSMQT